MRRHRPNCGQVNNAPDCVGLSMSPICTPARTTLFTGCTGARRQLELTDQSGAHRVHRTAGASRSWLTSRRLRCHARRGHDVLASLCWQVTADLRRLATSPTIDLSRARRAHCVLRHEFRWLNGRLRAPPRPCVQPNCARLPRTRRERAAIAPPRNACDAAGGAIGALSCASASWS